MPANLQTAFSLKKNKDYPQGLGAPYDFYRGWEPVGIGDFNADGIDDILWKHSVTGQVFVQLIDAKAVINTGTLGFNRDQDFMCAGDFFGSGRHAIVFKTKERISGSTTHLLNMWLPDASGLALFSNTVVNRALSDAYYTNFKQARDTNGDGFADIVLKNIYGGVPIADTPVAAQPNTDYVWCTNGPNVIAEATNGTGPLRNVDGTWRQVANGDYNADGNFDIWWRRSFPATLPAGTVPTGENYIYSLNGSTILAAEGYSRTVADLNWEILGSGQFDGAAGWDILFRNLVNANPFQRLYIYTIDMGLPAPFISTNEGYVTSGSPTTFDTSKCIGIGNFSAPAGPVRDVLWWDQARKICRIATVTFVSPTNFSIDAGTIVPNPPL